MPCIFLQELPIYQRQHLSNQAYLFKLKLSTAVPFLSIAFSHYFIHNSAAGPVSSPFYVLLDSNYFHLLSRTRLWSLRSHMASLTANPAQKGWSSQCCHCSRPHSPSCLDQPQQAPLTWVLQILIDVHMIFYKPSLLQSPLLIMKSSLTEEKPLKTQSRCAAEV